MLELYVKDGCPFCAMVLKKIDDLELDVTYKNIADDEVAEALISHGGKRQVPYLVDHKNDTALYESNDISEYLEEHHSNDNS